MIIPVFLPHAGCPERCTFCDQRVSGGVPIAPGRIAATIEEHLTTARPDQPNEVAFYGGTFTALARERQLQCLEAVRPFLESGRVASIRVATRPDAADTNDAAWMSNLRDGFAVRTVELGVQSFNPAVLRALGRSHSTDSALSATRLLKSLGLTVGWHLMIGCPSERPGDDALMLAAAREARPDLARIHPLLVIAGTALATQWLSGELAPWRPLELETAVARAAVLMTELENCGIKVIRTGLQPNELLGAAVLAGPDHPAFGDLVKGRILRDRAETALSQALNALDDQPAPGSLAAEIIISERLGGSLKGPQRANLTWLAERFELSAVRVPPLTNLVEDNSLKVRLLRA